MEILLSPMDFHTNIEHIRSHNRFMCWPDWSDGGFNQAVCELDAFIHIIEKYIHNVCRIFLTNAPADLATAT